MQELDHADQLDQARLKEVHPHCADRFLPGPAGGLAQMFLCAGCGIEFTIPGPPGAFPIVVAPYDKKRAKQVYGWKRKKHRRD